MIQTLTDQNYEDFITTCDDIVFIDFFSPSCGPCMQLSPILERLDRHFSDKTVTIAKVDITQNPKLAKKYMVQSIPLTIVVGKDKMVKKAELGLKDIDIYISMIEKNLPKKSLFQRFFS
jgi:thioredoxin 1